jgi:hypothetical protein
LQKQFSADWRTRKPCFGLPTDESLTEKFAAERKPFAARAMDAQSARKTNITTERDLLNSSTHREKLVLKPRWLRGDQHSAFGQTWTRPPGSGFAAQRLLMWAGARCPATAMFPLATDGHLEVREMRVDLHPQAYFGKIAGCSSWLSATSPGPYSTSAGMAPTFILDSKG